MVTLVDYMSDDHGHCDDFFAEAENAVSSGDWAKAGSSFDTFRKTMARHFVLEEVILFPLFETRTGMTAGPTMVMRDEHGQMNGVLDAMSSAVASRDADTYLGYAETLLMLMRQHNIKEEQILYPMMDDVFGDEKTALIERMGKVAA